MANETIITVVGNVTQEPELKFLQSGAAVCNLNVASTPRYFDRNSNEWKDGVTNWFAVEVFGKPAENVADSIHKGMQVIVQGRLDTQEWEAEGQKRRRQVVKADTVGVSLTFQSAQVTKSRPQEAQRPQGDFGGGWQQEAPQQPQWQSPQQPPQQPQQPPQWGNQGGQPAF